MKKSYPLIFIVLLSCLVVTSCSMKSGLIDPVVETQSGLLRGLANDAGTVVAFKGIPYAAPPVGDLRWREPQPPEPWEGVRDATEFCASCIQQKAGARLPWSEEFMVQNEISEDCLFLNIWTPAKKVSDKLAVLVYIHGGGFTEGSGAIDVYDGEELAQKGIIVVTINYRLGVLGLLVHPELSAESPNKVSGNYGYLDQIAALKWIQSNIANFGGDPNRVTIVGQSAGASSVRSLIISPLAKGLFHRAITESGSSYTGSGNSTSLADAEQRGLEFMAMKGASSLAELRAMDPMDIFITAPGQTTIRFGSVVDGYVFTGSSMDVFAAGEQNDTPFMTGMNMSELRYGGARNDDYYRLYLASAQGDSLLAGQVAAQEYSRLNAYLWLDYRARTSTTNGYIYYFDRAIPWPEHPEFGAFHTGEVPYVFNNLKMLDRPWTDVDRMVADMMSSYWANFAKNGDPNGEGLPVWDPTTSDNRSVMRLGEDMGMIPIAATEERFDFLEKQLISR